MKTKKLKINIKKKFRVYNDNHNVVYDSTQKFTTRKTSLVLHYFAFFTLWRRDVSCIHSNAKCRTRQYPSKNIDLNSNPNGTLHCLDGKNCPYPVSTAAGRKLPFRWRLWFFIYKLLFEFLFFHEHV